MRSGGIKIVIDDRFAELAQLIIVSASSHSDCELFNSIGRISVAIIDQRGEPRDGGSGLAGVEISVGGGGSGSLGIVWCG